MILETAAALSLPNILCGVVANGCTHAIASACKKSPAFGQLLRAGKLDANHDLEHLAHQSMGQTLQLLSRAIRKREEQDPSSEITSNYFKDCFHDLINDSEALKTLSLYLSIDSEILLSIPKSQHEGIARVLHPSLLAWLRAEFAKKPYGKDTDLPDYLVHFIEQGFPNPDTTEAEPLSCADAFANHYLAKLKTAATKDELKALRAFERLEAQDIRDRLIALGESNPSDADMKVIEETLGETSLQLEKIVGSLESLHQKTDDIAADVREIKDKITPSLQPVTTLERLPLLSLGDQFTGREDLLTNLIKNLSQDHQVGSPPLVLHGPPGVGKTTLSCELLYRLLRDGALTHVLHVRALDPTSLKADLAALPVKLRLIEQEATAQASPDQLIEFLVNNLDRLGGDTRVLLYIDNADTQEAITEIHRLLPQFRSFSVLITSRRSDWEDSQSFPVPLWDEESALVYLAKALPQKTPQEHLTLFQKLGGLPLALDLAAARIRKQRLSVEHLLELWQQNLPDESLTQRIRDSRQSTLGNQSNKEIQTLYSLVQISLQDLSEESLKLLHLLSCFAPAPLPLKVLALDDNPHFQESLAPLADSSLLEWNDSSDELPPHLLFHPFLQQTINQLVPQENIATLLSKSCQLLFKALPYPEIQDEDWSHWPLYLSHINTLYSKAHENNIQSSIIADILNTTWGYHYYQSNLTEAENLINKSLLIHEATLGPTHHKIATSLNNLALLSRDTGRTSEAISLMRRAIDIDEQEGDIDQLQYNIHLSNLALCLGDRAPKESEKLTTQVLEYVKKTYGTEHPYFSKALSRRASFLQIIHHHDKAEPLIRRALEIEKTCFGESHPRVAELLHILSRTLRSYNQNKETESCLLSAIEIFKKSLGETHTRTQRAISDLALLFRTTDRFDEAEPLMRRALQIDEASFGSEHPNIARHLNNLATLLHKTSRIDEAETLMRRALKIDQASYGNEHPKVAIRLNNLASLLQATKRLDEAEPLMRRALQILRDSLGDEHPNTKTIAGNLEILLKEMGK